MSAASLEVRPLTAERWKDFAALFATSPVTSACWCMWPRVPAGTMRARSAGENEAALRAIVDAGDEPGLLAYEGAEAVGWCSVSPRADYSRFSAAGDGSVWLIACLFVRTSRRGRRIGASLVEAAVAYALEHGALAVEGPPRGWRPDDDPASMERVLRMFRRAGFEDAGDREAPALMRREVRKP